MQWLVRLPTAVFLLLGCALRGLLRVGQHGPHRPIRLLPLDAAREALYQPAALEMQTQAEIVAVSLNDAIEQHQAGRADISLQLLHLSGCLWERLAEVLMGLLKTLSENLPSARFVVPIRSIPSRHFKSAWMAEYVPMRDWLDEFVFRAKLRFQIHIRLLRGAAETLSAQFAAAHSPDRSSFLWDELDVCFHDFDLVIKETLLAFRALLASMPTKELSGLASDVHRLIASGAVVSGHDFSRAGGGLLARREMRPTTG